MLLEQFEQILCALDAERAIRCHATYHFSAALNVRLIVWIFRQFVSHCLLPLAVQIVDYSKYIVQFQISHAHYFSASLSLSRCVCVCASISAENFGIVGPQRAHACEVVCSDIHAQMGYMHTGKRYRMCKWIVWYVIHSSFFSWTSECAYNLPIQCMYGKLTNKRAKKRSSFGQRIISFIIWQSMSCACKTNERWRLVYSCSQSLKCFSSNLCYECVALKM